jgi:hypothetical protein
MKREEKFQTCANQKADPFYVKIKVNANMKASMATVNAALSGCQMAGGFDHGFAVHELEVAGVMEEGKDVHADVLGGIGDDTHDEADAALGDEVHHLADFWDAVVIHGFELAEVDEEAEAGAEFGDECPDFVVAGADLIGPDVPDVAGVEEAPGLVGCGQKHKEGYRLQDQGSRFGNCKGKESVIVTLGWGRQSGLEQ